MNSELEIFVMLKDTKAQLIWAVIAAVHLTIPSNFLYLNGFASKKSFFLKNPHVFQANKGFVDDGSVDLIFQLQYIP